MSRFEIMYAHSVIGRPVETWETHREHASRVGEAAAGFAAAFGWPEAARAAGLLHDIGKCSGAFQAYIRQSREDGGGARGPDHSTAGAREALRRYEGPIGRVLAAIVAGHHAGLADGTALDDRLRAKTIEPHDAWQEETDPLPALAALAPARPSPPSRDRGFSEAFLTRMLFSCLVDADFIATEAFYAAAEGRAVERDGFAPVEALRDRLRAYMADKSADAEPSPVNALRARVLDHAVGKAALAPGFFTLSVPTGGGKTLAALSFALEHAARHGLRRVVTVIPFTSVIEQTASVFREALGDGRANAHDVLEHHATFDWEAAARGAVEDGRGSEPVDRLRRAAENWAAPVVVTTAVQFFESLFANRTSRCRKLHNLAGSVIVLDEAQTLPLHLLRPCLAALDELVRGYRASVVFCTATQPALRSEDGFAHGPSIPPERELAPEPRALYGALRRVAVERLPAPIDDAVIAARFAAQERMLCIVNRRAHAQALHAAIRELPGAVHLSTLMVPAHRRLVLEEARARLARGEPVRIVSTSLIEAGIDIDLPEVWRAAAGIDSIAQAAGRCNREGRLSGMGRVVVFEPVDGKAPPDLRQAWEAGRMVLRGTDDPLGLDAVRDYFQELYWAKGPDAFDAARLDGDTYPILREIAKQAGSGAFPFASIARAFRLIEDVMEPVIVPWRAHPDDREADTILARIAAMEGPLGPDLRRLQAYIVAIPKPLRARWLATGVLRPVHPRLGDALLRLDDASRYDEATGLRVAEPLE